MRNQIYILNLNLITWGDIPYDTIHIRMIQTYLIQVVSYHCSYSKHDYLLLISVSIADCNVLLPKDCQRAKRGNAAGAFARLCDPCEC